MKSVYDNAITRRTQRPTLGAIALGSLFLLGACVTDAPDDESVGYDEQAAEIGATGPVDKDDVVSIPVPSCPDVPACDPSIDVNLRPSLLLTSADPGGAAILNQHFQLTDVLQQLISEAGTQQSATNLFRRLWDTQHDAANGVFNQNFQPHCDDNGSTLNGFPLDCERPEKELAVGLPSAFVPVAVFNRFDLAATDGSHCGEYRIIYAMDSTAKGSMNGRNFIIFEGQLPNPTPFCGVDSCRPVAEFWAGLSTSPPPDLGAALRSFYFDGLPGFGPVITPANYGFGASGGIYGQSGGQIRTNQFGNFNNWQLREFQLDKGCFKVKIKAVDSVEAEKAVVIGPITKPPVKFVCHLFAKPVTVKDNPFGELFNDNPADPLTVAFQADFVNGGGGASTVAKLAASTIPGIGLGTDDLYNSGQSTSQPGSAPDVYPTELGSVFAAAIQTELTNIGSSLSPTHIARRAMTQSCAGCHQHNAGFSAGSNANLGGGLTWPPSLNFVHVNESGTVSQGLANVFLPHREQVLEEFLQACMPMPAGAANSSVANKAAPSSGSATKATLGGSSTH